MMGRRRWRFPRAGTRRWRFAPEHSRFPLDASVARWFETPLALSAGPDWCDRMRHASDRNVILAQAPGKIQQTGFTTEERRPHGRNLSTRRALTAGRLPFRDRLSRSPRRESSPQLASRQAALIPASSRSRALRVLLLRPGGMTTVTVPLHGVPAGRRQESCQFRHMAPRGRLASGPFG